MNPRFDLYVPGRPVPQGSKTAFINKSTGRPVIVDKDMRLPQWRMKMTAAAIEKQAEYMHTAPNLAFPLAGPIGIRVIFTMERPKSHFGTGKNANTVKASSPVFPDVMPDIDKLLRAVFDALTDARVWVDDAQVVWCQTTKVYADDLYNPGVYLTVGEML
jgi:Holliday junction resolvase RusA-like endonuclease